MSKVMIVEDDDGLREIYGIRLTAEGYEVVSAHDGEEALAIAVKERPDLIVSDVMMPKISGFDMLDILRSTPETRNIRIIMMTALSSEDQRERGENLGADRYLVKSQVGIEDVVNVVHEVLGDRSSGGAVNQSPAVASVQNLQTPVMPPRQDSQASINPGTQVVNPASAAAAASIQPTVNPVAPILATSPAPAAPITNDAGQASAATPASLNPVAQPGAATPNTTAPNIPNLATPVFTDPTAPAPVPPEVQPPVA